MNAVVPVIQPGLQISGAAPEQRSHSLAPPQLVCLQIYLPDRVLSGFGDAPQPLFALAQRLFGPLLFGDVALRSPGADHGPVLHDAGQVVQEVFRVPVPIDLMRYGVHQVETGAPEGAKMFDVPRVRPDEQFANPRAQDLIRGLVAVHLRHRVVALGEVSVFKDHLDLLALRQIDRDRLFEFEAPDRFRTIRDESAVTLLALPQVSHSPRSLDRLPAPVGYLRYNLDLPRLPVARRILADYNPRHIMSVLD